LSLTFYVYRINCILTKVKVKFFIQTKENCIMRVLPFFAIQMAMPFLCSRAVSSAVPTKPDPRPNVLLIVADDLNDFVGPLRSYVPGLTPNMDRLAARGVNFRNAHANGLYCAPSRTSLLTGLYPTTTGYYSGTNDERGHMRNNPVIRDAVTLPEFFLQNGYATFLTGKVYHINPHAEFEHFKGDAGDESGHGVHHDFGPWPWDGEDGEGYIPPNVHPALPPPFDQLAYAGYSRLSNIPSIPPDPGKGIPGYTGWTLNRKPWRYVDNEDRDLLPDERSVEWASTVFQRERERPFLMIFGFNRPHTPLYVPDQYFDLFPLDEIVLPPMPPDDLDDIPEEGRRLNDGTARQFQAFYESSGEQGLKEYLQAYLASIRFVDDQLGLLLDALEAGPAGDNTLVILTSDHGYHVGEKARIGKNTCWERSTRVPLLVAGAGVHAQGAVIDQPVSLVDLYPTLIEMCRMPLRPNEGRQAPGLDGYSLVPILNPEQSGVRQRPDIALSATDHARTVRSETHRYILHNGGGEELYDMTTDPDELNNLAGQPPYSAIQTDLRARLETIGRRTHAE